MVRVESNVGFTIPGGRGDDFDPWGGKRAVQVPEDRRLACPKSRHAASLVRDQNRRATRPLRRPGLHFFRVTQRYNLVVLLSKKVTLASVRKHFLPHRPNRLR